MSSINDLIAKCKKISEDKNADVALKDHCAKILQKTTELDSVLDEIKNNTSQKIGETIKFIDKTLQNIINFEKRPNGEASFFENIKIEIKNNKNTFKIELANVVKIALEGQLSTLNEQKKLWNHENINIKTELRPEFLAIIETFSINIKSKKSIVFSTYNKTPFSNNSYVEDLELYESYKQEYKPTRAMRYIHTVTAFFAGIFGGKGIYHNEIQLYDNFEKNLENAYIRSIKPLKEIMKNYADKINNLEDKIKKKELQIKESEEIINKLKEQLSKKTNITGNSPGTQVGVEPSRDQLEKSETPSP